MASKILRRLDDVVADISDNVVSISSLNSLISGNTGSISTINGTLATTNSNLSTVTTQLADVSGRVHGVVTKSGATYDVKADTMHIGKQAWAPSQWKTDFNTAAFGEALDANDSVNQTGWYSCNLGVKNNRYNPGEWKITRETVKHLKHFRAIPMLHSGTFTSYHPISDDKYIYAVSTWGTDLDGMKTSVNYFVSNTKAYQIGFGLPDLAYWTGVSSGSHGYGDFSILTKLDRFTGEILGFKTMNDITGVYPDPSSNYYLAKAFGDGALRGGMYSYGDFLYIPSASLGFASVTKVRKSDLSRVATVQIASINNAADRFVSGQRFPKTSVGPIPTSYYTAEESALANTWTKELIVLPPVPSSSDNNRKLYPLVIVATSPHAIYEVTAPGFEHYSSSYGKFNGGRVIAYYDKGTTLEKAWEYYNTPNPISQGDKLTALSFPFEYDFDISQQRVTKGARKTQMRIHYPLKNVTVTGNFSSDASKAFYQDNVCKVPVYYEVDTDGVPVGHTCRWGYINLNLKVDLSGNYTTGFTEVLRDVSAGSGFDISANYPVYNTYTDASNATKDSSNAIARKEFNPAQILRYTPDASNNPILPYTIQSLNIFGIAGGIARGTDISGTVTNSTTLELDHTKATGTTGRVVTGKFLANNSTPVVRVLYSTGIGQKVLDQYEAYSLNYYGSGIWGSLAYDADKDTVYIPTGNINYVPLEEMEMIRECQTLMTKVKDDSGNLYPDVLLDLSNNFGLQGCTRSASNWYSDKPGPFPGQIACQEETTLAALKCFPAKFALETSGPRQGKLKFVNGIPQMLNIPTATPYIDPATQKPVAGSIYSPLDNDKYTSAYLACRRHVKAVDLANEVIDVAGSERIKRCSNAAIVALNATNGALKWFRKSNAADIMGEHYILNVLSPLVRPTRGMNADHVSGVVIPPASTGRNAFTINKRNTLFMLNLDGSGVDKTGTVFTAGFTVPAGKDSYQGNDGIETMVDPYVTPKISTGVYNTEYVKGHYQINYPATIASNLIQGGMWGGCAADTTGMFGANPSQTGFENISFTDVSNAYNVVPLSTDSSFVDLMKLSPNPYWALTRFVARVRVTGFLSTISKNWYEDNNSMAESDTLQTNPYFLDFASNYKRGRIAAVTKLSLSTGKPIFESLRECGWDYRGAAPGYAITLTKDMFIYASIDGQIRFHDIRNGAHIFTYSVPGAFNSGTPVVGGMIYAQDGHNKFFATNTNLNRFLRLLTVDGI